MPYSRRDSRNNVRTATEIWNLVHAKSQIRRNVVHLLLTHGKASSNGMENFTVSSFRLTTGMIADSMGTSIKRERIIFNDFG